MDVRHTDNRTRCTPTVAINTHNIGELYNFAFVTCAVVFKMRLCQTARMMGRRIAIVGSGQAGLVVAHGLVQAGHEVTLYSDRSAEQWLSGSRPTGTAARFELALAYERELGLAHWEEAAPKPRG